MRDQLARREAERSACWQTREVARWRAKTVIVKTAQCSRWKVSKAKRSHQNGEERSDAKRDISRWRTNQTMSLRRDGIA